MHKTPLALAILFAARSVAAQTPGPSSFELSGVFDIGIGYSQHSLSQDANYPIGMSPVATRLGDHSNTGMFNGGLAPSRLTFKDTEDMGSGLKAFMTLETGFNPFSGVISNGVLSLVNNPAKKQATVSADSSLAGQLFNREANVGISSSEWGSVSIGRNYSFGYDTLAAFDPMEASSTFSPFGYSGSYGGGGSTEDYRVDNSIKYKIQSNGVKAGLLYKFGAQGGLTGAQSEIQGSLGYENARFAIQGTYSSIKDGIFSTNSNTTGALDISVANTVAYMLAASYKTDLWRLRGGYERIRFANPSNPALDATTTNVFGYPVGAINLAPYPADKHFDLYFTGLSYNLLPQFRATVAGYLVKQNNFSIGACITGVNVASCSGTNQFYSMLGDYSLSKRTHLYAGYMYNRVHGGFSSGFLHDANNFAGGGIKHSF